jgi:predicted PurR-regulated permease PerM
LINTGDLGITPISDTTIHPQLNVSPAVGRIQNNLHGIIDGINSSFSSLGLGIVLLKPDLGSLGYELLSGIQSNLLPLVSNLVSLSLNALFMGFLFVITLLYLFTEYDKLPRLISRISPLDDDLDHLLFNKFTETTRAVIIGNFLVAIAQASAVSGMLLILGVGAPVLLWVLMVILSLVPIGSGLVWLPVGIGLALSGNPLAGVLLIVYSAIIINVIDTSLRPQLLRGTLRLHPLVIIFSALGGIGMFGPLGILYGPLIAVFFTSLMDVYTTRYSGNKLHHTA